MNSLLYYKAINAIRLNQDSDFVNFAKIYKFIGIGVTLTDRTEQFEFPIKTTLYNQCQLPTLQPSTLTYRDCCNRRAQELWELSHKLDIPIGIMWSGGIDSTRILVSFLENYPLQELKDRIRIITSEYSKLENPSFYYNHILPNFELISSELAPWLFDKKMIIVTGEFNDQLFGSDTLLGFMMQHSDSFTKALDRQDIFNYVDKKINDPHVTNIFVDAVIDSARTYGVTLEKNADWFWWFNFCFKWQTVYFRILSLIMPKFQSNINPEFMQTYVHHFFNTTDFQLWSISNPQNRILKRWKDYKHQAKLEIYQFDKNQDYYENKTKRGSLVLVFQQRVLTEAIDSNFNFYKNIDLSNFINRPNVFQ